MADALEHRVRAEAASRFLDALDRLVAALDDDVGRADSRASAIRSLWRPSMMICSAPSRFAAITPHRPTAPSPTTAVVWPGATPAARAAWWPVPITSDKVRSDGISASSLPTGRRTRVPSACGTRTASPWPPSRSPPHQPPCRHDVCRPSWQNTQVPSDHAKGATTRSPAFRVRTSSPTASRTPMNSWPILRPCSLRAIWL